MSAQPANGVPSPLSPPIARRAISVRCTLTRAAGSPIGARTIDLGTTGMRVATERPLAVDEMVAFELPCGDVSIRGQARVVCQERPDVYAIRFGPLQQPMARCLRDVVRELPASP
jgi:hypothetical protein